mgnify:CR=1 FL=1
MFITALCGIFSYNHTGFYYGSVVSFHPINCFIIIAIIIKFGKKNPKSWSLDEHR